MSSDILDEITRFVLAKTDDPEMREQQRRMVRSYIKAIPELYNEVMDKGFVEGRLSQARSSLRRVLTQRQVALSAEEQARIDACDDLFTLRRWLGQAVVAATAAEALR